MRTFFISCLTFIMTVPMLAERFQYGDLYYEVTRTSEPRTVSVTYEKKSSSSNYSNLTHVSIPSHVVHEEKTYTVTSISRYAFQRCSSLVSIIIPNTITSIAGDDYNGGAFSGCSSLENVTIGSGVNSIGDAVFSRCSSLKSIIVDENNVTYDSRNNCNALIETATNTLIKGSNTTIIPNTITTIGGGAFHDLSSLTTIVIPDNVVTIGNSAFSGSSLKEVYIGVGLTDLESGAFSCDSLKTVFWNAKSCSDIKNSQYRRWSNNSITSFSFGDSVKHIPNELCESLYHLQVVTIGKNVESIGYRAFYNCDSLKTITIPKNVKSIGNSAFYDCDNLLSLDVENAHASIGESAFKSCNNLLVADLGNCITTLEAEAFRFCESLSSIIIPTSITRIGDSAFDNCLALASVELPSSLISIGKYAFQNCSTLVSITIPKSVKSIDNYAFGGCRYISRTNYTGDIADWCKITFGNSKANPIYYSRNIYINEQKVRNLIIPNTVDSIQNYAFYNCYSLDSVSIEATTPPVLNGSSTFSSSPTCYIPCGTLAAYQSSSWAEQVGSFVEQCDEPVVDANKCGDNLYWAYTDGTLTITGTGTMYNYDDMDNLAPWNSIRNNIKNIVLPEGLTSIGEWAFYLCASVTSISIPEGVSSIGVRAFCNCRSLTSISIPNSVTSVGERAFYNCYNLASVTLSTNLSKIDKYLFGQCRTLTAITIPNNVTAIENGAFYGCSSLDSVYVEATTPPVLSGSSTFSSSPTCYIPCGTLSVYQSSSWAEQVGSFIEQCDEPVVDANKCGDNLYWAYTDGTLTITGTGDMYNYDYMDNLAPWNSVSSNIKNIVLPEGLTSIGEWAFYLCASVTSISIPEGVSSIGVRAFCNCNNLTSISIPNSVTSVGERAFYNCYNLASVTLSTNLSKIDKYLFGQCRTLTAITIPNNVTAIENGAFSGCSSLDSVSIEATTPPVLSGSNTFSSSPVCYIPCGTLAVYQSSSWAEQVGGFVEQCNDNENNQSLISVTDGTLSDWDKLPAEYVSSCVHQKGASLDGLKSMKVYADERHINLFVEYKPETITSLEWTNFRIYINTDNSDLTGGCGASWSDANTDILLETALFASGKPNPYNPAVYKWWGEVGDNSWDGWYDPTIELAHENCWGAIICEGSTPAVGNSQVIGNYIEIQIDYKRIPADWNKNQFTLGVEIDQNWDIAGLLPNASNGELGSTVLAEKLLVNVHPINAPILTDGILYEITSNEEPLTAEVYACTDYTIAEVDIPASITHEGQIYDVTSIGNNAFSACTRLTSITIPNSVMSIGDAAFFACFGLTEVTIPNSVTSIGELAFYNCRSLSSVILEATTPPTLGSSTFSSSPVCYIPCGTLAAYQSSSWAEQVGSFVEQCDDNNDDQSLISVTDATLSDWDNLPMEYLFETKCVEGASWDALKSVKVYADLTYINLVVEWDTEIVTDLSSVPFHVYLNVDNDAPTGGFGDQWVKPNIDLLLEGYFYLDGNPCAYQPDVALYAGTPLANEWAWDWTTIESLAVSQLITKGVMEIQIEYGKLPVKLENTFTVGFDIQQSWSSVGVLPNAANDNSGNSVLAEKMLVRINNVNTPTSVEDICSPSSITNTHKLLRNGQLIILHDGKTYTVMGAEIK